MARGCNGIEHRWGRRVRVNIPVHIWAQSLAGIDGFVKNLSLSGALMKADFDLRLHALIEVTIKPPSPSQRPAVVLAHVARKLEEDIGVEWCEFAPSAIKELLQSPAIASSV